MAAGAVMDEDEDTGSTGQPPQLAQQQQDAAPAQTIDGEDQQAPQGGNVIPQSGALQKGTIPTPDLKPEYDNAKLAKANNPLDILNAMKPKSRNEYMDWYEQTHGAIDDHYDKLMKDLGQRPEDSDQMSRKEKFAALLEFGLHLMKASSTPTPNQGAALTGALSDTVEDAQKKHAATIAGQQQSWDTRADAIEKARQGEQKQLGTFGQALSTGATIDQKEAQAQQERAGAYRDIAGTMQPKQPMVVVDDKGKQWEKKPDEDQWRPSTGIDGKQLTRPVGVGPRGGMGHTSVYSESLAAFDQRNPLPANATDAQKREHDMQALAYAKGKSTVDATLYEHARQQSLRELGSRTNYPGTSEQYDSDLRSRTADIYDQYERRSPQNMTGPGSPAQRGQPPAQPQVRQPPPSALVGLKPGMSRPMTDGSVWSVGIDGKPHMVKPPRAQIQPQGQFADIGNPTVQ